MEPGMCCAVNSPRRVLAPAATGTMRRGVDLNAAFSSEGETSMDEKGLDDSILCDFHNSCWHDAGETVLMGSCLIVVETDGISFQLMRLCLVM